ncbi:hypothetical protein AGMMS50268_35240 [Spirochaetia bacterium]|nr:hypothetical protein AGMMS50268_35240 [Spirochaetia bacterium]
MNKKIVGISVALLVLFAVGTAFAQEGSGRASTRNGGNQTGNTTYNDHPAYNNGSESPRAAQERRNAEAAAEVARQQAAERERQQAAAVRRQEAERQAAAQAQEAEQRAAAKAKADREAEIELIRAKNTYYLYN